MPSSSSHRNAQSRRIRRGVVRVSRLPSIDPAALTPEQHRVYDAIVAGPRGAVYGPFLALLRVPELADRVQHLGELLRYDTSLGRKLCEIAIITSARAFHCEFEWAFHAPIAAESGVPAAAIAAIEAGEDPGFVDAKERAVHAFTRELAETHRVSAATYAAATAALGEAGVVELAAVVGYYAMLAMTLNAHEIEPVSGSGG